MENSSQTQWNLQNLEIATRTVEKQLEPLVIQVTTLLNRDAVGKRRKGKSKKPAVLVAAVERATQNFIEKGEQIAYENREITQEMLSAVDEVKTTGLRMSIAAADFADDPFSSRKRTDMVSAARRLLAAVTRLLILADMVDVKFLVKYIVTVQNDIENLKTITNGNELTKNLTTFQKDSKVLMDYTLKRQQDITDPQSRDDLAAARAVLKKCNTMLMSATKIYIQNPQHPGARDNRDRIIKQICEAVETINDVAHGRTPQFGARTYDGAGDLASALDQFDERLLNGSLQYKEVHTKISLEQQLEDIISSSVLMTESDSVKDERRQRILDECGAVREALQGLLSEYINNVDPEASPAVKAAREAFRNKTKDLRRQLRKALVDQVSDSFLEPSSPLLALVDAARRGDDEEVATLTPVFIEHSKKLIEVARAVCNLSNNPEGAKMARYATVQLEGLTPGVVSAAEILAAYPADITAQENMNIFQQAWENQVKILTEAIDEITTIDDVLSVFENQILDDINKCVEALQRGDMDALKTLADGIRGRLQRITDITEAEMDNYEPCTYTRKVLQAIKMLNGEILTKFNKQIDVALSKGLQEIDENEFIDTTRLVYDGIREVRRAVLMNRADEDLDPEEVELEEHYQAETDAPAEDYEAMSGITYAREVMNKMPEKDKRRILEQVEIFQTEKLSFDREVDKWDDAGNDIIALAKYMCLIMMQMTDFIRQRGPLKSTLDVINSAKKISEAGTKLDKLARTIADQCPESSTKQDLLAYLERVSLYCHQINIISKVKADVQNTNEDLILAGVDSATSLIENAKNLMNAVVLTVKASYVASTKYSKHVVISGQTVVWKMKAPEKKPLVRSEKPNEVRTVIRRASQKKAQTVVQALAEFENSTELV